MNKNSKKDSAVSPVIGTILLVAITVVLVAIISAVVMGMTGDVDSGHVVGMEVKSGGTTADTFTITFLGGDAEKITALKMIGGDITSPAAISGVTAFPVKLGTVYTVKATGCGKGSAATYNIIGTIDGKDNIIWTGVLTIAD